MEQHGGRGVLIGKETEVISFQEHRMETRGDWLDKRRVQENRMNDAMWPSG